MYGTNAYLPYAAGCIAAYAWANPAIQDNYRLGHFTFLRTPLAQAIASLEEPYMVAFSNYVWNFEYHKALAKAVKERWPGCLILFGGHQVFNDSSEQLEEYPYVDFLIHKAGELPFEKLLLTLLDGMDFSEVPSLSYRDAEGKPLRTEEFACASCNFPSPYLAGLFDSLFAEYPKLQFSMTLETNRGCPYGCAFCDWGAVWRPAFHHMPMERVRAEIDWAARHKIEFVICADANFGILDRDEAIVDYVIDSKRRTGYPEKFNASFAKNSDEAVFRLNQKLSAQGLSHGATLSFQSLSPVVLNNIGRKNLGFERFQGLISLYNQANVPAYSDLIVGLPGETLDSHARGIGTLLAAGMHGALEVRLCELLPNAALSSPSYREKHGIESVRVRQFRRYSSTEARDEIPEYSDIVCKTNTMPEEDWVAANLFSTVVQGFHGLGLLTYTAIFLYWELQLPYERFYFDLMDYARISPSTLMGELFSMIEKRYRAFLEGKGENIVYSDSRFGNVAWPLDGALFLCAAYESDRFFEELPAFLRRYAVDAEVLSQFIRFQRAMVHLPSPMPSQLSFPFDFPGYYAAAFAGERPTLQKKCATVLFPQEGPASTWAEFARDYVWYGRKQQKKAYEVRYD